MHSAKALKTRARILETATALFHSHGYHTTGIDRIIATAEVSKGSFFYHFRNKEALASAVLAHDLDEALSEFGLADGRASEGEPRHALLALLAAMAARMSRPDAQGRPRGCLFGNLAAELSLEPGPLHQEVRAALERLRALIAELLRGAQQRQEIMTTEPPERLAGMILSLLEGAALLDKSAQRTAELPRALHFIEQRLLD
ncbi:hypothetical protein MARPU_11490 [Marichromatium purpuratum 984]|uniref:HTH tetR-type domain-containing protein n=1 Tax=Marichromatium purpuratum 984 TaxID=765910 RepID=W0E7R1_MARPU|nr:TetR/AcrR family transcriptional regulator [Marichromatium purpuratum]AHF05558.1 hypothetical protein MARPU_11490 [Marichromatium purpuratum 984]